MLVTLKVSSTLFAIICLFLFSTNGYSTSTSIANSCGAVVSELVDKNNSTLDLDFRAVNSESEFLTASRAQRIKLNRATLGKERLSIDHQNDVIRATGDRRTQTKLGLDSVALELGEHQSDLGKQPHYQLLLTDASLKSNFLLDILKGNSSMKSADVLKEFLAEVGFEGRSLLNRNLSNEEIRAAFRDAPSLKGYLHALPGLADAFIAYEKGAISATQLKKQIGANLFHNGPAAGFWKFLEAVVVPADMKKAGEKNPNSKAIQLFDGTVYKNSDGKIAYPFPTTAEGIFHTIADRLSQATRGGVLKIYLELTPGMPPVRTMVSLLLDAPRKTMTQLESLAKYLETVKPNEHLTRDQIEKLKIVTYDAIQKNELFARTVETAIDDYRGLKARFVANEPFEDLTMRIGETEFREGTTNVDDLFNFTSRWLEGLERQTGDPMAPFVLP